MLATLATALQLVLAPAPATTGATPTVAASPAMTLSDLLGALRTVPGVRARYRETRHITLLAAPLISEGTLHFAPLGRLARHQRTPGAARMVVAEGKLRFADEFGADSLELARNPVVALFVESFLDVLAGDEEGLRHTWAIGFSPAADGDPQAWVLALRPRGSPANRMVERIVLRGRGVEVTHLEVFEVGGDRTVTELFEIDTKHVYDADEAAKVFSVQR